MLRFCKLAVVKGMGLWEAISLKSGPLGVFFFLKGPSKLGTKAPSSTCDMKGSLSVRLLFFAFIILYSYW